jgi:hypothetical protein
MTLPLIRVSRFLTPDLSCRDAWKSVEGTTKEQAWKLYVDKLVEVRLVSRPILFLHFGLGVRH